VIDVSNASAAKADPLSDIEKHVTSTPLSTSGSDFHKTDSNLNYTCAAFLFAGLRTH
jgi:hypothetical protein